MNSNESPGGPRPALAAVENREREKGAFSAVRTLLLAACIFALASGCESSDSGSVSGGVYYGVGFYDPWYYGGYYDDVDIIVTPPDRPEAPARPTHPIARPPASAPRPTPMPSIPSMPRPSFRR